MAPRLGERCGGGLPSVEGKGGLGKAEPVRHLALCGRQGFDPGPFPAQRRPVEGRRRQRQERVAQCQMEEHLLAVVAG